MSNGRKTPVGATPLYGDDCRMTKWTPATERLPEVCTPVIGYADRWVDAEYNELGMRECFHNDDYWQSAAWNNYQDCWDVEQGAPDYWRPYPAIPGSKIESPDVRSDRGCQLAGPGRGDCEHFVGYPSPIHCPGQHDGPDDTVDVYGKPNGWCWSCWKDHRYYELLYAVENKHEGESRHQTALRYIRNAELCKSSRTETVQSP